MGQWILKNSYRELEASWGKENFNHSIRLEASVTTCFTTILSSNGTVDEFLQLHGVQRQTATSRCTRWNWLVDPFVICCWWLAFSYTQVLTSRDGGALDSQSHGLNRDAVRVCSIGNQVGVIAVADGCGMQYWSEIAAHVRVPTPIQSHQCRLPSTNSYSIAKTIL